MQKTPPATFFFWSASLAFAAAHLILSACREEPGVLEPKMWGIDLFSHPSRVLLSLIRFDFLQRPSKTHHRLLLRILTTVSPDHDAMWEGRHHL